MLCRHHKAVSHFLETSQVHPDIHHPPCYEGKSFAVLDLELTAPVELEGKIIEIGAVLLDQDGQREKEWETLVNPGGDFSENVHGLLLQDVEKAPSFEEIAEQLFAFSQDRVLVAHQVEVEQKTLQREFGRLGMRFDPQLLCTQRNAHSVTSPTRSLHEVCSHLNIPHKNPHRALGDAQATAGLFQHLWHTYRLEGAPLLKMFGTCQ